MTAEHPLRGHLYWVRVPDEPGGKRRPALVMSSNVRNRLADDVIVVPLSTRSLPAPTHVRLRKREGGLPAGSSVKAEQITTLPRHRLALPALGGPLSPRRLLEVEKAILRAIDVPVK
jgi:mRNA-degrading endonuclease toxin of MazEF toxin-antitoxin module